MKIKSKKSKKSGNIISVIRDKKEQIKRTSGLLFLFSSVFLLLSFVSFLFSWKYDQSLVNDFNTFIGSFKEVKPELAQNWMGIVGAYFSHLFLCRWFGISSFLFILLFFLLGMRLLFDMKLMPLRKTMTWIFFFVFWGSIVLGLIFNKTIDLLGGAFGIRSQFWLRGVFGGFGTVILLIFVLLTFVVFVFNVRFSFLKTVLDHSGTDESQVGETESDNIENSVDDPVIDEENESEEDVEDDKKEIDLEPVHNEGKSETDDQDNLPDDGVMFEVEKAQDENGKLADDSKKEVGEQKEYDPSLELSNYKFPTLDLLKDYGQSQNNIDNAELEERKNLIIQTLKNYGIEIDRIKATVGSTITLYEIVPVAGVRISKIKNLEDDIALSLSALGIRIIAPMPGKGTIGIEVPNSKPEIVSIRSVIGSNKFKNYDKELPIVLGRTISNEVFVTDLAKAPHLLIAGATGQGKSVGLNVIIASLLYKKHPSQVKFVLVDPKKVELSLFQKIENHFLAKLPDNESSIITDTSEVVASLHSLTAEMDARYLLLKDAQVRNIVEYNRKFIARRLNPEKGHRYLPYIVLVIDELADLMMTAGKEVEMPIARLAQLARAIGIHLIVATQRPSVNIITGTIKANFPVRIAFKVTASVDSRTILDTKGADQLIGRGDMLFSPGGDITRIQCALIETEEVESVVEFISDQPGYSNVHLLPEVKVDEGGVGGDGNLDDLDELFEEAARIIVQHQQGSTSLLQRRLKLGYNRAGRLIDQLETAGIVGPFEGSKARSVLIPDEYALEQFLKDFKENQ